VVSLKPSPPGTLGNWIRPAPGGERYLATGAMLKSLLAERFHLQVRSETKELPVYVLSVDKGGFKLTPHRAATGDEARIDHTSEKPLHIRLQATAVSMEYLARQMGKLLDRNRRNRCTRG
jgi:uncharacterized protein (TIGR03435 family)